jgi:predicted nucleic acid-binding protein
MPNESRVYWDNCAFIDRIEAVRADRLPVLRAITGAGERGELAIVTSVLSMAEVVKLKDLKTADHATKEALIKSFFENDYIHLRAVDPRTSGLARRIVRDHGLKPPDAIHIATAILSKTEIVHTCDDDKMTPLNGKIKYPEIFDRPLRIEHPKWQWQPSLFDAVTTRGSDNMEVAWSRNLHRKFPVIRTPNA